MRTRPITVEEFTTIIKTIKEGFTYVENGKEKGTTRINSTSQLEFAETFFQNFTGHPACSLPCGFTKEGLPIGIQVVGKKYHDDDMFYLMSRFYN